jgi:hypothetical protein
MADEWRRECISGGLLQIMRGLRRQSALDGFYLAGGTALALHIGHRRSVDLDFFSPATIDGDGLLAKVQALPGVQVVTRAIDTLHVHATEAKVSFRAYPYPLLFPLGDIEGVELADPRDIACMKVFAIASRGTKRDFVDLYVAARQFGLRHLLSFFREKFRRANYSDVHVRKSLVYFEEAEMDPTPDLLAPLDWTEVKRYFQQEVARL